MEEVEVEGGLELGAMLDGKLDERATLPSLELSGGESKLWEEGRAGRRFARGVGEQLRYCHPSPRAFCSYLVLGYFL